MSIFDLIAQGGNNRAAEMYTAGTRDRIALNMAGMEESEARRGIASRTALEEALRTKDFSGFEQSFPVEAGNYQAEQETKRLAAEKAQREADKETLALHSDALDVMRDGASRVLSAYDEVLNQTGDETAAAEAAAPLYAEVSAELAGNPVLQRLGLADKLANAPFDPSTLGAFITQTDDVVRRRDDAWETVKSPPGYAEGTVIRRNAMTGREEVVQGPQVVVDSPSKLTPSQQGTQVKDFETRAAATRDVIGIADDVIRIVKNTPEAVGWSGAVLRIADDVQGAAQGLASAYGDDFQSLADPQKYDLSKYGLNSEKFNMKGVEASRYNAAIMSLAYADARSQESGKLSEGDVKAALQRIGGDTSNPRAAVTVLQDMVRRNVESLSNYGEIIEYEGNALDLVNQDYRKFRGDKVQTGEVEDGWRYIGPADGDRADPANWEKVK